MKITTQTYLTGEQKEIALKIWNTEYPVRLQMAALADFEEFLATLLEPKYYFLLDNENTAGWAATFTAGPVRSFFIMLHGAYHGKGYGTILLNELKKEGPQLFAWAIDHNNDVKPDGRPYPSPINFYLKNGFTVNNDLRLEDEVLSAVNILWQAK
ncbi:GNAT family N-acetyltransferase [Mucilaginibacter sp. L3T2-6]|uniref:GNAT family N-acetyltransferase n=1 Tax=Mucilaginibacter sp. L3T2-6 TaxID=3062491 RepID=UPI002676D262|nr:GNAT family N-acetyltransferase [Mucilaginibacter sp. L3T2-6]MDO3644297.1 GNAT family N-acetyltransferase [Mucilaginibacter sp. L3T2-6]MDV6216748.1 GNAT family N-acetyltransferase [Mucilaginibacter sp. L3T2-6]